MAAIEWVLYNERVVGQGSPTFPDDVDNRPLKQVMIASGLGSVADDFPGFPLEYRGVGTPEAVVIARPGTLYFQTDTPFALWIKKQNTDATGWDTIGVSIVGTPAQVPIFTSGGNNLEDSIMRQTLSPDPLALIIGSDPNVGGNEVLRITGGFVSNKNGISNGTIIGINADVEDDGVSIGASAYAEEQAVALGNDASANHQSAVAIGNNAVAHSNGAIAIGRSASVGGINSTTLYASIVIGRESVLASVADFSDPLQSCVVIGPFNTRTSDSSQPIGYDVIIGVGNTVTSSIGSTAWTNIVIGAINNPGNASNQCIVIGSNFTGSSQLSAVLSIGHTNHHDSGAAGNIMIGSGINFSSGSGGSAICIGNSSSNQAGGGSGNVAIAIGFGSRVDADFTIAIGGSSRARSTGSIAIGRASDTGFALTDTLVIGPGSLATVSHQAVIGSVNTGGDYREIILGNNGDLWVNSPQDVTWRMSDGNYNTGSNVAAGNLIIRAGLPTGNSLVGGEIQFKTGAPAASGFTQQVATKQFAILLSDGSGPNIAVYNVASGAGAGAGTLANAPHAGDPTFWLPIQIMGATYYVPAWS